MNPDMLTESGPPSYVHSYEDSTSLRRDRGKRVQALLLRLVVSEAKQGPQAV